MKIDFKDDEILFLVQIVSHLDCDVVNEMVVQVQELGYCLEWRIQQIDNVQQESWELYLILLGHEKSQNQEYDYQYCNYDNQKDHQLPYEHVKRIDKYHVFNLKLLNCVFVKIPVQFNACCGFCNFESG